MAFKPGELTTTDLSPNANILGTQIADNTIQLRNLTDDTFRIISTGQMTVSNNGSGTGISFVNVAHGLSFTPIVLGFLNNSNVSSVTTNGSIPLPTWTALTNDTVGHQVKFGTWLQILADPTNIIGLIFNSTGTTETHTITYYLLQEAAKV